MLTFHIITLFPESFDSYIKSSIIGRAIKQKKIAVKFYNPRDFADRPRAKSRGEKPYLRVDDRPYGGGPGMVMQAEPILKAISKIKSQITKNNYKIILFSPAGKQFDNKMAKNFAARYRHLVLICGRYEGIDGRVQKILKAQAVSVGPYIVTGGELPALVVLDTTARQIEGVLGKFASLEEKRIASHQVYTRPEVLKYKGKNYRVPKILLSGHHAKIDKWRSKR